MAYGIRVWQRGGWVWSEKVYICMTSLINVTVRLDFVWGLLFRGFRSFLTLASLLKFYRTPEMFEVRLFQVGTFNIEVLYLLIVHRVPRSRDSVKKGKGATSGWVYVYLCNFPNQFFKNLSRAIELKLKEGQNEVAHKKTLQSKLDYLVLQESSDESLSDRESMEAARHIHCQIEVARSSPDYLDDQTLDKLEQVLTSEQSRRNTSKAVQSQQRISRELECNIW